MGDYPLRLFNAHQDFGYALIIRDDIQQKPARAGIDCSFPNFPEGVRPIFKQEDGGCD